MSRRYTPEERAAALAALDENRGDTAITSLKLGLPQRTLQAWKRAATPPEELLRRLEEKNSAQQAPPQQPEPIYFSDDPEFEAILRRDAEHDDLLFDDVLKQLMTSVRNLVGRLDTNFDQVSPLSQMMAITRLLDRILKLEARKPRIDAPSAIIIRYQDTDGSYHKMPHWATENDYATSRMPDDEDDVGGVG